MAERREVDPERPEPAVVAAAVRELASGGLVALPTETFYGLAARADDERALARLDGLKGREGAGPLLLLVADGTMAAALARALPPAFAALAAAFWPGPLTLVLPARAGLPAAVRGPTGGVGLRVPGLALPRAIARGLGGAITGTSANRHGVPPATTAAAVAAAFPEGLALVLDGGACPGGAPSTLLDLTGPRPRLLREGRIAAAALRPYLGGFDGAL